MRTPPAMVGLWRRKAFGIGARDSDLIASATCLLCCWCWPGREAGDSGDGESDRRRGAAQELHREAAHARRPILNNPLRPLQTPHVS